MEQQPYLGRKKVTNVLSQGTIVICSENYKGGMKT